MRVGFLFNHDQVHQIAHSLPVALALSVDSPDVEIVIAVTSYRIAAHVLRLAGGVLPRSISIQHLGLRSRVARALKAVFGKLVPAARLFMYRDNLDFFGSLDALVVTERTSLILKTRFGLTKPFMILIDHGAGDRAIGFGSSAALYDHILAAGPKIRDRLTGEANVDPARLTITGYPKFDSPARSLRPLKFRDSEKPIILYNPHVSPHLSSWYKEGRAVLDFFLKSDDYNLIFAPHIMLFERSVTFTVDQLSWGVPGQLHAKYGAAPNIHVDLGSAALTDMTYTNGADVYLGDVSSQIYEFLKTPRPCVFINAHDVAHQGDRNYAHWRAGPVVRSVDQLGEALRDAIEGHAKHYRPVQQELFDYTFSLSNKPSSERAADVIIGLLSKLKNSA